MNPTEQATPGDDRGIPAAITHPPRLLGAINDYWGGRLIDVGGPGPDRGLRGRYLVLPPGYDGLLPKGGFFIARPKTTHVRCSAAGSCRTTIRSRRPS